MVEVADGARRRGGQCAMEADDDARDQIDREREGERGRGRGGTERDRTGEVAVAGGKSRSQGVKRQTQNKCRTKKVSTLCSF